MIEKITWVVFWVPPSFCILTRHRVCFGDNGCLNSMAHLCPSQTSVCSAGCIPQSPWCDSVTQKCQVVRSTVQPSLVPAHMPWGVWVWAGGWTILLAQQKHHRISQEGFSLSLSLIIKRKLVIIWSFFFFDVHSWDAYQLTTGTIFICFYLLVDAQGISIWICLSIKAGREERVWESLAPTTDG